MKILFIGGTGNISTDCAALLHKRGHEISVITRGKSRVRLAYNSIVADRKNLEAMRKTLDGVTADVVINFLGYELPDVETDYALFAGKVSQYRVHQHSDGLCQTASPTPDHRRITAGQSLFKLRPEESWSANDGYWNAVRPTHFP